MPKPAEPLCARYRLPPGGVLKEIAIARLGGAAREGRPARADRQVESLCAQVYIMREDAAVGESIPQFQLCERLTKDLFGVTYVANRSPYFHLSESLGYARVALHSVRRKRGVNSMHIFEGAIRRNAVPAASNDWPPMPQRSLSPQTHLLITGSLLLSALEDVLPQVGGHDGLATCDIQIDSADPSEQSLITMLQLELERNERGWRGKAPQVYTALGGLGLGALPLDRDAWGPAH